MKICAFVFLLGATINCATSMIHSLVYFQTFSSEIPDFPEYVSVGIVNDVVITHYDNNTKRVVPKQEWMKRVTEDDPQYWDRNTQISLHNEQTGKANIEIVKQRLNVSDGPHILQRMHGCHWDDKTNEISGYYQIAFDGEDFIALDWDTQTWVAPKQEAFITKLKWEKTGEASRYKRYIEHFCVEYLKKFVRYGAKTLMRTELPLVSFLQKSPSSPVTCHATGFYPDRAMLFWTKDGEELYEDVEYWEVLPNHDGTFQKSADLDLSSVPAEDWDRYSCVFQLSGFKYDLVTKLDPLKIRTNAKKQNVSSAPSFLSFIAAAIGYFM